MADLDKSPDKTPPKISAAEAAKRVKRTVQVSAEDGKVLTKDVPIKADEVLAFKDYGTHVVVVTRDGQKLSSSDASN